MILKTALAGASLVGAVSSMGLMQRITKSEADFVAAAEQS
jgi:hypothetical protein